MTQQPTTTSNYYPTPKYCTAHLAIRYLTLNPSYDIGTVIPDRNQHLAPACCWAPSCCFEALGLSAHLVSIVKEFRIWGGLGCRVLTSLNLKLETPKSANLAPQTMVRGKHGHGSSSRSRFASPHKKLGSSSQRPLLKGTLGKLPSRYTGKGNPSETQNV